MNGFFGKFTGDFQTRLLWVLAASGIPSLSALPDLLLR
jgi:hypothetical protein